MKWKEIGGKALDVAPSVVGALTGGNPLVTHGLEYLRDKITGKKGAILAVMRIWNVFTLIGSPNSTYTSSFVVNYTLK